MPLQSEVHVDRALTNFAVEYKNEEFIGREVCPWIPVDNKTDDYFVYSKKDRFTRPETIRGPTDTANEIEWAASTSSYKCIDRALRHFLPDSVAASADAPITPREKTTEILTDLILLDYEMVVAARLTTSGNYGSNYKTTLSGGDRWDVPSSSNPIDNVKDAHNALFRAANTMILGKKVWDALKDHPSILDRIKGGAKSDDPAIARARAIAEVFEVSRILVAKGKYNTANKGQTASFDYIWGNHCVLCYLDMAPAMVGVSAFKTFGWRFFATSEVYQVRAYRQEDRGGGGEWIEVETSFVDKAVCSDLSYLIINAVS